MKYVANPVIADGWQIIKILEAENDGLWVQLETRPPLFGKVVYFCTPEMLARMTPEVGDYVVKQEDGYTYLNPKDVFERKYSPVEEEEPPVGETVTVEQMKSRIVSVIYTRLGQTVTICQITLDNGYSVRGESACVDPANFNERKGQKYAYENAFNKLWPLFGFLLAEDICRRIPDRYSNIERAARVAHEVNRAYCEALGDTSQPAWEDAPEWQRESAMEGVRHVIGNPSLTPRDSHESWLKHKEQDGWSYGPIKDSGQKEHPCFLPYEQLPAEQKAKDFLFRASVKATLGL